MIEIKEHLVTDEIPKDLWHVLMIWRKEDTILKKEEV